MDDIIDRIKIYEIIIDEEHYFSSQYDNRLSFFLKIISTFVGVTIVGFFKALNPVHYIFLFAGPIIILFTSKLAKESLSRTYQRLLETITMRAKIEQDLGLTQTRDIKREEYWFHESYIPQRFLKNRSKFDSSQSFIDYYIKKGNQLWSKKLFDVFQYISIAMFVVNLFKFFMAF